MLPLDVARQAVIVDLGAGSGILLEKILTRCPLAKGYWVDFSEGFLAVARKRLADFAGRVEFILSPLEAAWESQVADPPDAMVSMSAIHHLERPEKQRLYRRCLAMLAPGGWFLNVDEMKTLDDDAYLNSLLMWVRHVEQARASVPQHLLSAYEQWTSHFAKWRERNVANRDKPKVKGDDIHEGFLEQTAWLKEAGFVNVDLFMKYHLWCLIGGQKPTALSADCANERR
jgi:cyclopropane fatty-acyl-phospholipid synthase-like methyltransferase